MSSIRNNQDFIEDVHVVDGWIKLDDNVLKHYLDGFALSYCNGLYYEQTGDYSYETGYSIDDYIKFLKEKDNQVNHEGSEELGFQKVPSRNRNRRI